VTDVLGAVRRSVTASGEAGKGVPLSSGVRLSEVSPRDQPWDEYGKQADRVARLLRMVGGAKLDGIAKRITYCCPWLRFAIKSDRESALDEYASDLVLGNAPIKLQFAFFCHTKKWCSRCVWRRDIREAKRFRKHVERSEFPKEGRWLYTMLSLKNVPLDELRSTHTHMTASLERMMQHKEWRKSVLGYVRSTEITIAPNGYAHPHFNLLTYVSNGGSEYKSQEFVANKWGKSLGIGYKPYAYPQEIKPKDGLTVVDQAVAVLKYGMKPGDLTGRGKLADAKRLAELILQADGLHFFSSGGVLHMPEQRRETNSDLVLPGEGSNGERQQGPGLRFRWSPDDGCYLLENR
jgi:hypothetical protein